MLFISFTPEQFLARRPSTVQDYSTYITDFAVLGQGVSIVTTLSQSMGVLVKSIAKNSPASQKIWPQDLILEVEVEGRRYTQVSNITGTSCCTETPTSQTISIQYQNHDLANLSIVS